MKDVEKKANKNPKLMRAILDQREKNNLNEF